MSVLKRPPVSTEVSVNSLDWVEWFESISDRASPSGESGTTANRPTTNLFKGRIFFDETLGKPIWWKGTEWVDATGTGV